MRVVVTGGAGFIGAAFVRHALRQAPEVHVTTLDALTYAGDRRRLADLDEDRHTLVTGDVRDAGLVADVVAGADAVVHFAAETHVDRSIDGPRLFSEVNVVGSAVVFDACRRAGVRRLVHVSTDEVYGPVAAPSSAGEASPLAPSSPYAASKAGADHLAAAYGRTYGYPITVTRPTNTFGPFQHPEKVVARFVTRLIDGGDLPVFGDGQHRRQWLPVADTAAAHWLVLTEGVPGEVYNVGPGEELSTLDLARALVERFGLDEGRIADTDDRPGHDRRYAVDGARIRSLGWAPRQDLGSALDEVVSWYRRHEDWWRPLVRGGAAERRGRMDP